MTEAGRTQIKTANRQEAAGCSAEQNLYSPCKHILDNGLALKSTRSFFILGAALLLGGGATLAYAEADTRSADEVLIDSVPEKSLPQLQEILTKALLNAPRVIDSGLNLELSGTSVKMARAPMLPNLSAGYGFGGLVEKYNYGATSTLAASNSTRTSLASTYSVNASQPIYRWGALKKGYQSAQLQRAIAERNLGEVRRALASDVRRAYFNLIIAANAREAERTTLANLEKERDFQKQQQADGFVTASAVGSVEISIADFKLQMRRTESSYDAQWRAFCQMTGMDETSPRSLPKEIPALAKEIGPSIQALSDKAGDILPNSLLNADDSISVERLNYEIYKTRLRPQVGLSLSAYQDRRSPDNNPQNQRIDIKSYSALTTVSWSIFDGFTTQALKQSSLIRLRQLKNSRDQAERDYQESLRSYVTNLQLNWESLQKTEVNLASYRSTVETYQKDFEAGFVPKKTWDDAKIGANNALQAANNARADYYMQIVNYLSLRGRDPAVNPAVKKQTSDAAKN
jgi:outer membrane protein TolC